VTRWLRAVGDVVAADEPLLEVSTDKVDTEIPAPAAGTLLAINVTEDQTVPVGTQLGLIGAATAGATSPGAVAAAPAAPAAPAAAAVPVEPAALPTATDAPTSPTPQPEIAQAPAPVASAAPAPAPAAPTPAAPVPTESTSDGYVTPLVRRLAEQHGIDLSTISGTGVGGRIRKQDVLAAASAAPAVSPTTVTSNAPEPSALRGRTEKMPRLRRVIAERMVQSLQVSAQLTTVVEVDLTRVAALRDQVKREFEGREGVKLSFLPFFCLAAIEALKEFPQVNASLDMAEGTVTYHDVEHLGIAVDTERGLLVPVIRDAGDLNIAGLARRIADVADRTRTNKVSPDELSGGTFTITNTGSRGSLFDTPIINQPQVAILGTGAVVKRPIVLSDESGDVIAIRSMVYLALSYDHRLVDGADAARFLGSMKQRLEDAAFEAELGL